jgi:hypothetical protein
MYYTFLPSAEQKNIKREYRIRAAIVLLFFLSVALVVGVGSLFPAYIHASQEEASRLRDVAALKNADQTKALESTENSLTKSSALMSALASSTVPAPFSAAIAAIAAIRGPIVVTSFSFGQQSASSLVVIVEGNAGTRASLLSFKSRLLDLAPGVSVDLPISELARDNDIQFSMQVTEPLP